MTGFASPSQVISSYCAINDRMTVGSSARRSVEGAEEVGERLSVDTGPSSVELTGRWQSARARFLPDAAEDVATHPSSLRGSSIERCKSRFPIGRLALPSGTDRCGPVNDRSSNPALGDGRVRHRGGGRTGGPDRCDGRLQQADTAVGARPPRPVAVVAAARRNGELPAPRQRCDGDNSQPPRPTTKGAQFILPATTRVHRGGGLAARTPCVLTMHATGRSVGVGAADSRNRRGPRG
jgi:hypothetical protein